MKIYFRTGKNSGIRVGPIGAIFLGTLYLSAIAVVALAVACIVALLLLTAGRAAVRAARERKS